MLQRNSVIQCADNSGAKKLKILNVVGSSRKKLATIGDIVVCSVQGVNSGSTIEDHEVVRSVIVRTKKEVRRDDGSYVRFDDNAGVIVDKNNNPVGTRIFGPIAREIRDKGYTRIVSLAKEVW